VTEIVGYKFLTKDGIKARSFYGNVEWSMPQGGIPGEWHRHNGSVVVCKSGFHAYSTLFGCLRQCIVKDILCVVEAGGNIDRHDGLFAASEMRVIRAFDLTSLAAITSMIHGVWVNRYIES